MFFETCRQVHSLSCAHRTELVCVLKCRQAFHPHCVTHKQPLNTVWLELGDVHMWTVQMYSITVGVVNILCNIENFFIIHNYYFKNIFPRISSLSSLAHTMSVTTSGVFCVTLNASIPKWSKLAFCTALTWSPENIAWGHCVCLYLKLPISAYVWKTKGKVPQDCWPDSNSSEEKAV